jgi:hypothetical protein
MFQSCREQYIGFMFSTFFSPEKHIVNKIMWKNMVEPEVAFHYQQASTCFRHGFMPSVRNFSCVTSVPCFFKRTWYFTPGVCTGKCLPGYMKYIS